MAGRSERSYSCSDTKSYSPSDTPPNSRLFIICSKQLTEDDFQNAFSKFGLIEEIRVVRDHDTGDNKGVVYIKYSRTSEAAHALEAMNGKVIGDTKRHIKVMVAASRDQGAKRECNEDEKLKRLFVIVSKTMTDDELYDTFKIHGDIDYATIIKDKETRESKGFAYVKYKRFSQAAIAYEQCDRKFKAVFAEPRKPRQFEQQERSSYSNTYDTFPKNNNTLPLPDLHNDGFTKLQVIGSPQLNQDQIWKLFDLIPGMDYCQVKLDGRPRPVRSVSTIVYNNTQAAAYACEKLHGFEYPLGNRLIVKPDYDNLRDFNDSPRVSSSNLVRSSMPKPDILQLAETIAQATSLIQAAGLSPDLLQSRLSNLTEQHKPKKDEISCSVELPNPKPLANFECTAEARCFIVCSPQPLSSSILKNVFCRFGNLIDVYMLFNKNCGYAKYTTRQSAENAIRTLHGAEVCGIRIKVMEAEERDNSRKRLRLDDDSSN